MSGNLTDKLEAVFKKLRGPGKLSESNIRESMREVRQALLEADVNYKVARDFVKQVESRAVGAEVLSSIEPGQMVINIVETLAAPAARPAKPRRRTRVAPRPSAVPVKRRRGGVRAAA